MFKSKKGHKEMKETIKKYKANEKLISQNTKTDFEKAIEANKKLQDQFKII